MRMKKNFIQGGDKTLMLPIVWTNDHWFRVPITLWQVTPSHTVIKTYFIYIIENSQIAMISYTNGKDWVLVEKLYTLLVSITMSLEVS